MSFEALESDAVFDRVLYDGAEFGMQAHPGSEEEQDYLGIPGLLEPDQVRELLHSRQSERAIKQKAARPEAGHGRRGLDARAARRSCVASSTGWSPPGTTAPVRRTAITHATLRKECGGPAAAVASAEQLHERIDRIRDWAVRKSS